MTSAAALPNGLFFDLVSTEEVNAVHDLEAQGFTPDEAATLEKLRFRQANAPDLFLGAFIPQIDGKRTLLGYIDGVLSSEATLTAASMSTHVPGARTVLIHGVCVTPEARGRGIASALLAEYQQRLVVVGQYDRAVLIAHEDKVAFYERVGFKSRGFSNIAFAGVCWIELEWVVPLEKPSDLQGVPQMIPSGLLEGMQGKGVSLRKEGKLLSSFQRGIFDVSEKGDQRSNLFDLLCVNERCGSIILRQGVAVLQERESVQNVGFSKPTHTDKPLKLLACAECDLGPIGWCEPVGSMFWVACQRVRYRT
ncbi:acyl-CoA N-acyltransferase [Russula earlei]|uniref:Acyl-CoA N-acyltransferase n=1 Tax=Russula earlei TaxID=71964 RepID=A0ACC0TXH7_9AGAM|nr:acyl-CoA N-acyltransferase [Russula earlei]